MSKRKFYQPTCLYFSSRLTEALGGICGHPLTIVEAPMGYGKTTAVREHLNRAGVCVLWQAIYDGTTATFWNGFCKLFAELDRSCSVNLAKLGLPDDSVSRQEALELLEAISLPEETVLVLDDYHLIQNGDIHDFIVFLVKNVLTKLHIVIITRMNFFEPLEELKLKGYAHHITKESFELTPGDIATYYSLCGIDLKAGQIGMLYKYTEGWISALYLLMLDYIKEGRFEQETPGLPEALIANIYNLVEKAIYMPLSKELQDFLVHICIFDSFTKEQAAYIWRRPNTARLLGSIVARKAFLAYEPKTQTYHLHNILTTFLRDKLCETVPRYQQDLYQKAGEWYLQVGAYLQAMQCFCRSGDFDSLLTALERDKADSIDGEHKDILIKYFDGCPREILENHPTALGFIGRCMFLFNEKELYTRVCRTFTHCIENGNLTKQQRNKFLGEYERLLLQGAFNDIGEMARHHYQSCKLLQGIATPADLTESWALYGSPSSIYLFYRESGKLEQTVDDALKAMSYYADVTNDSRQAVGYIMAAERHFLLGEFGDAQIILHQVFHAGNPDYRPGFMVRGLFLQARLALVKGDFSATLSLLLRLHNDIHDNKLYLFMHTLDLCEAFIYAHLGQKDRIPSWIAAGEFKKTRLFFPAMGFVNLVYGRVLLIHGEYAKLIGNAEYFIRTASFYPNIMGQIYVYIQLAAAYRQIYRKDEALSNLQRALDLAIPDRVVMPFVENCDYIRPLLEQMSGDGRYFETVTKILELDNNFQKAKRQIIAEHFSSEKPQLTDREQAIAELAAAGLTNSAIGARLFISPNTVKTQLKSIFAKLGINSRALLKQHLNE